MTISPDQIEAAQAIYSPRTLAIYDAFVLGFSNRYAWKCSVSKMIGNYDQHVSANHLDVGVGTGYLLDRCRFPAKPDSNEPRVALMDINENALQYSARRIARYNPETHVQNILEPISIDCEPFDSVGINFLLHCLPGTMESKSVAFDNLRPLTKQGEILFGSTILHEGISRNWIAKRLMNAYNNRGIFCNRSDNAASLTRELHNRFHDVAIEVIGCVAIFSGRF